MEPIRLYRYLRLARTRVIDWARKLDEPAYRAEHPIGLGSLARTLHHVRAAEASYMHRVRGATTPLDSGAPEDDPEVSSSNAMGLGALAESWAALADRTERDIESVTDWHTERVCETVWEGRPYRYKASSADFYSQLFIHEVHHRTQALHMLRLSGVVVEDIDFSALMWPEVKG